MRHGRWDASPRARQLGYCPRLGLRQIRSFGARRHRPCFASCGATQGSGETAWAIVDSGDEMCGCSPRSLPLRPIFYSTQRHMESSRVTDPRRGWCVVAARSLARGLAPSGVVGHTVAEIETPLLRLREMARRSHPDSRRRSAPHHRNHRPDRRRRRPPSAIRSISSRTGESGAPCARSTTTKRRRSRCAVRRIGCAEHSRHAASPCARNAASRAACDQCPRGVARAFALRLCGPSWQRPRRVTRSKTGPRATWKMIARAPSEILDLVRRARSSRVICRRPPPRPGHPARRLRARRMRQRRLGPDRGSTAHETCSASQAPLLVEVTRAPPLLNAALSPLFSGRLVDSTRCTALGSRLHGSSLAWCGAGHRPSRRAPPARHALPMMSESALVRCASKRRRCVAPSRGIRRRWVEIFGRRSPRFSACRNTG